MWTTVKQWLTTGLLPTTLAMTSCSDSGEVDIRAVGQLDYKGRVQRIETLGRYSSLEATLLFQLVNARSQISSENDYLLYRVVYPTTGVHGELTTVSGLVAIPVTRNVKGIVSWQHGTNTYRPESISKPSVPEGLGVAGVFASYGFILAAADYIGLGVSTEPHPYYHYPTTVGAVVDLLSIVEIMLEGLAENPDHDLYLTGFSQGGGATAAVQKFLEDSNPTGLKLRGAAPIAGAFDPQKISLDHAIKSHNTLHLAFILTAFSQVYGASLSGVVQEPYDELLPGWFDGSKDGEFLQKHLPSRMDELMTESFLRDYTAGEENPQWFYDGLKAADTSDYAPLAPLRIHYGSRDTIVIPEEAHAAFTRMQALGGNVELIDAGPYDHDEIVVATLPLIQQWFNDLERHSR